MQNWLLIDEQPMSTAHKKEEKRENCTMTMAKVIIYSSFFCTILLSTAGLVFLQTVSCKGQVAFGPDHPDDKEVIFVGENLTLRCEIFGVNPDETVEFFIFKDGIVLIAINRPTNLFGNPSVANTLVNDSYITFVLLSIGSQSEGQYECKVLSGMKEHGTKVYRLELQQQDTVHCRRNVTDMFISMKVLELSCYFSPSENKIVKWFQNDTNGMVELSSTEIAVNPVKHRVVSVIQPSDELNLSNYVCRESQESSTGVMPEFSGSCEVGSFVIYNDDFIVFTPKLSSIPPGSSANITCDTVNWPSGIPAVALWQLPLPNSFPVGVNASIYGSDTLQIQVSTEAEVGIVVTFTCLAYISEVPLSTVYSIAVLQEKESAHITTHGPSDRDTVSTKRSSSNSNTEDNNNINNNDILKNNSNFNDNIIIIIIVSLVAIVITTSFTLVVCFCLCRKKRDSKFEREDDKITVQEIGDEFPSVPVYGEVNKNKNKTPGVASNLSTSLEQDHNDDWEYNLVYLPTNPESSNTGASNNFVQQNQGVEEYYSGVTVNQSFDDNPTSVFYSTANKRELNDEEYY